MERVAALDLLRGTAALSVAVPHFIMLNSAADWAETVSVLALQVAVYLGICLALSAVFYHVFERPILAMRPDYRRPSETAAIEVMPLAARAKSAA